MEEMFFCPNCMAKTAPVNGKCPVCGSNVNIQNAPHQLPVNCILNGRYLVGKVLGAGGFGITYIGYDLKLDSKVAIKEYYPSGAANRSSSLTVFPTTEVKGNPFEIGKDRFLKEAKTLSEFVGEGNIVTLRDYFEENGTAYIVMEYLEGDDLSHYAKAHGKFELDEALDLLEPAMLALDKVHKKGLIHRDISPSNIMVMSDGRVKVLDFGSARLQNASGELSLSIMLKPGYAPAEQYSTHGEQGSWTDVYAMSATVYRLITGKTLPPSADRILDDTIELPSSLGVKITPEQEAALMRGLALRVPDRTQTMAELAKGLREGVPVSDKKSEKKGKTKKSAKPKKKKGLIAIAAAAVVVLTAAYITVPKAMNTATVPTEQYDTDVTISPAAPNSELTPDEELDLTVETAALHRDTTINAYDECAVVGVKPDGTVVAMGTNQYGECEVSGWTDIVMASSGFCFTIGLKSDGTVVAAGSNAFGQCDVTDWEDIVEVSAGERHAVGLKSDGSVVAVGFNQYGECDVSDWTDIVAVSAGEYLTVGLKSDGTVIAAGYHNDGRCDVFDWTDIVAVSAGGNRAVGLKSDGTVVANGMNNYGECDVSDWTNIVAVSAGYEHTVGLKADGTVVAAGDKEDGECDVSDWRDIVAVSAGYSHTVGLKSDGTVVSVGVVVGNAVGDVSKWKLRLPGETNEIVNVSHDETTISAGCDHCIGVDTGGTVVVKGSNVYGECSVSGWTNILAVSAGGEHSVGLKLDGTVVAAGNNDYGQCDVSGWTDIVAVSAGYSHTVGLKTDGTVVATGHNGYRQCSVSDWTDIVAVDAKGHYTVGLKSDGTVVATGINDYGECNVSDWTDIIAVSAGSEYTVGLKSDGTVVATEYSRRQEYNYGQCNVSAWTDIVAVSAGVTHTVGLKSDGTVLAVGNNSSGQCDVSDWTDIVAVSTERGYTVGLKTDGTVVATGKSYNGLGKPYNWKLKLP